MSELAKFALGTKRAVANPPQSVGPLLEGTVVKVDGGVFAHVAGEEQDRGPLAGQTTGVTVGAVVLIGQAENGSTWWLLAR